MESIEAEIQNLGVVEPGSVVLITAADLSGTELAKCRDTIAVGIGHDNFALLVSTDPNITVRNFPEQEMKKVGWRKNALTDCPMCGGDR